MAAAKDYSYHFSTRVSQKIYICRKKGIEALTDLPKNKSFFRVLAGSFEYLYTFSMLYLLLWKNMDVMWFSFNGHAQLVFIKAISRLNLQLWLLIILRSDYTYCILGRKKQDKKVFQSHRLHKNFFVMTTTLNYRRSLKRVEVV